MPNDDLEIIMFEPEDYIVIELDDLIDLSFLSANDPTFMENEVIRLTNIERQNHGLKSLIKNEDLGKSALLHTLDMVENHFISHDGSDGSHLDERIKRLGILHQFTMIGENLAMGYLEPETVVQGWMHSPGHRENMLKPEFNQIGVAYIEGDVPTQYGRGYLKGGYWTQHFGTKFTLRSALGL